MNVDGSITRADTTITNSNGKNKILEVTALAVMTWSNNPSRFRVVTENSINYLVSQIQDGKFGAS